MSVQQQYDSYAVALASKFLYFKMLDEVLEDARLCCAGAGAGTSAVSQLHPNYYPDLHLYYHNCILITTPTSTSDITTAY